MSNDALLSSMAYMDFFDKKGNRLNTDKLKLKIEGQRQINKKDIDYFFNNYEIIHQQLETKSGYSGMIVKDKKTKEFIIVHRGTNDRNDFVADAVLVKYGLPHDQFIDAKNYITFATTSKSNKYSHLKFDAPPEWLVMNSIREEFDLDMVSSKALAERVSILEKRSGGGLISGSFRTVGHSLGKTLSDLIHLTTNNSTSSIGINGAGFRYQF